MWDTITGAKNGERRVVLQHLLYGVTQRLWYDNIEATLEYLEHVLFGLDLNHQSRGQHTLREKQQLQWIPEWSHVLHPTRTWVLTGDIEAAFRDWYPSFRQAAA